MYDIVTFGSATWDAFLTPERYKTLKDKDFVTGKGVCFNLGSKVDVKDFDAFSGGGGTNAAAGFSSLGFKTAYVGSVGKDVAGKEILEEISGFGVDTFSVFKKRPTNFSVVLSLSSERTILVFRGASELLQKKDIPWEKIKAKWFYLAPLSGKLGRITEDIVDSASKKGVKVALNPGNSQLSLPKAMLKRILRKVDVLFLNREEASLLTGIDYKREKEIFKKIDELCPGIAVMTKGAEGSLASDGKNLFSAKIIDVKVEDRTGAGDSFGSGFISAFISSDGDIEKSLQLGTANSASCLQKRGAKRGLLEKGDKFEKVKVEKFSL